MGTRQVCWRSRTGQRGSCSDAPTLCARNSGVSLRIVGAFQTAFYLVGGRVRTPAELSHMHTRLGTEIVEIMLAQNPFRLRARLIAWAFNHFK